MSYNVPIPEPKYLNQKLARIVTGDDGVIEVFWLENTKQVVFHLSNVASLADPEIYAENNASSWCIQNNGSIIDSLCYYLPYHYYQILLTNIFAFEDQTLNKGKAATKEMELDIYDCEWSDFACEKMVLHMDASGNSEIANEQERWNYVLWKDAANDDYEVPQGEDCVCGILEIRGEWPMSRCVDCGVTSST
jgi:hypothetical protein